MELKQGYKQTEAGMIPEDWGVIELDEAANIVDSLHQTPTFTDEGYPMVRVSDIKVGNLALDEALMVSERIFGAFTKNYVPKRGDIVLSRVGSYGISSFVDTDAPFCIGQNTVAIHPKLPARFLYYALNSRNIRQQIEYGSYGSGYKSLSLKNIKELQIPLPPLPEQRAIAAALSDADALIHSLDQLIAKKRNIKQATMQELLTGKRRLPGFSGEWETVRFGDYASPRKERIDPNRYGALEKCIDLEHIESETGRLIGSAEIGGQSSLKTSFLAGDVLFGKLRAYLRKHWLADRAGVCSTEIWALVSNRQRVISKFLFQIVKSDQFIEIASTAYGTHMPRSDWNIVKNYEMLIPPLPEQTAIAAILSDMDEEILVLEAKRDKTRALKQGMMQELLTGRTRLV